LVNRFRWLDLRWLSVCLSTSDAPCECEIREIQYATVWNWKRSNGCVWNHLPLITRFQHSWTKTLGYKDDRISKLFFFFGFLSMKNTKKSLHRKETVSDLLATPKRKPYTTNGIYNKGKKSKFGFFFHTKIPEYSWIGSVTSKLIPWNSFKHHARRSVSLADHFVFFSWLDVFTKFYNFRLNLLTKQYCYNIWIQ